MTQREKYEWANLWWENADDADKPRVLLIGDSITNGYRRYVQEKLRDDYLVDMMATSKAVDDPAFFRELRYMLGEYRYEAIHFNNGLHGEHMSPRAYAAGMRRASAMLTEKCGVVIAASSTPVTVAGDDSKFDPVKNAQVLERNRIAADVAAAAGMDLDDLYAAITGRAELRSGDGYHFNGAGYSELGGVVAASIIKSIGKKGK